MQRQAEEFPTRSQVWRGAALVTIAAALWVQRDPKSEDLVWEGEVYCVSDGQGGEGVVVFGDGRTVGGFFDHESDRSPIPDEREREYDWRPFFAGIPPDLLALVQREILPRMRFEYRGILTPIVTAAFWGRGDQLTGAEPWDAIFDNGGFLLETALLEPEEAIEACRANYAFSNAQVTALRSLFERRMASQDAVVSVAPAEGQLFRLGGEAAIEKSRALLAAVSIGLP